MPPLSGRLWTSRGALFFWVSGARLIGHPGAQLSGWAGGPAPERGRRPGSGAWRGSALTAREDGLEPAARSQTGGEGPAEDGVGVGPRDQGLHHRAELGCAVAPLDGPGHVLAAHHQGPGLPVVLDEQFDMVPGQLDALGESEVGEEVAGRDMVDRLPDEPEVAQGAPGDHDAVPLAREQPAPD